MALFDEVKEVIRENLDVGDNEIREDSSFIDDLNADSLDVVEFMMALEDKFKIEIPEEDAANIKTVKDVVEYIERARK